MPKAKRRKNLFGFGQKSSGNYIPATGGIAHHSGKRKPAKKHSPEVSKAIRSLGKHHIIKSGDGYRVPSLDSSVFDTRADAIRFIRANNPKRRKNIWPFGGTKTTIHHKYPKGSKHGGESSADDNLLDDATRALGGRSYKKLTPEGQALVRKLAAKMKKNPRKRNTGLALPKNQFVNAKVRMKGGKIQVMADESALGKAGFRGGVSVNPKRKRRAKRK